MYPWRLLTIVSGISHAYGGVLSALSIDYSLVPLAHTPGKWKEREVVTAVYVDREEILAVSEQELVGNF